MKPDLVVGIDPGFSGATVILDAHAAIYDIQEWEDEEVFTYLIQEYQEDIVHVFIEKVYSSAQMSHDRAFKFGANAALQRGICMGAGLQVTEVIPQKWQSLLELPKVETKTEHKNNLKDAANKIWPSTKWKHSISDAALIAHYGFITLSRAAKAHSTSD